MDVLGIKELEKKVAELEKKVDTLNQVVPNLVTKALAVQMEKNLKEYTDKKLAELKKENKLK